MTKVTSNQTIIILILTLISFTNQSCRNYGEMLITVDLPFARNGCITVYSGCNYTGQRLQICSSIPDLSVVGWNDKIASIFVGYGSPSISYYKNNNYNSLFKTTSSRQQCLTPNIASIEFPTTRSSIECIILYETCGLLPADLLKFKRICADEPSLGGWNDKTAKIIVEGTASIIVYIDENYGGASSIISSANAGCLINADNSPTIFYNEISSIKFNNY